jgi:Ca2+-binding RTX toxin-like protein
MATGTTVSGGVPGSPPVVFNSQDAAAYGQALGNSLTAAINNGTLTTTTYSNTTATPSFLNPSTAAVASFTSTPTAATSVLLGANVLGVVDTSSTPLALQGGGAGVSVLAGSGGLTFSNITASGSDTDTIVAGDGANYIATAMTPGTGNYVVNTGAGNDTIGIFNGNGTVNAGTGSNLIVLGGGPNSGDSFVFSEGFDSIVGNTIPGGQHASGGTDTVDIGSGQTTINPGSSNFFIFGNQFNAVTLLLGEGSDTVQVGAGGGNVTGGLAGSNILIGGSGGADINAITLQGTASGDQLFAVGSGVVTAIAGAGNETISGAGGAPTGVQLTASSANNTFVAGTGNDTLIAGTGADTLVGSSGTALMVSGTGAGDTFSFTNGQAGGSDTITGFKATDTLQLNGYGTTPITSESLIGGSTVVTLNDGTTLTFAGAASVPTAQIKTS